MKKLLIYLAILIITYLIVGYVINTMFVAIDWIEDVTIYQKLKEYYVRTFFSNLLPTLVISSVIYYVYSKLSSE